MNRNLPVNQSSGLRLGSLAIAIGVFCVLLGSSNSLFAQGSEREKMDELLKQELKSEGQKAATPGEKTSPEPANNTVPSENTAPAPNPIEERYKPSSDGPSLVGILFRIILVLGILCGAAYWILKTAARTREGRLPVQGEMNLLSSLVLGTNKQLQIVEVTGQIFVLGVADNGINLISEIKDPETKARLQRMKDEFQPPEGGFLVTVLEQLKDLNIRITGKSEEEDPQLTSSPSARKERQKKLKQKLDEIKKERNDLENGLFDLN
ncbi:flagellar biosynthetic protein FliO [Leptospira wolffii]|uniref:FliO/MopB family protein n=1 Tax=Leptospira wolffii TaxID=409998 RepID=UPI001084138A|nr:flagellar biosynthetic protein FliO [Leptospira wolffii]TGK60123.1 flagellar biosynthetic protein FliO [Leptospira wolffii]TGK72466.1 flagellar biosynthetic protein FliO [Leptospira wolffii]TGK76130.1 flagellar biosynthetic protein FliO [Leptospira wolffii]TGL30382.1 flagellar biosynthetic protein FliO [Leptospira wolffii]